MPRLSARFIETEIQHPERGQRIIRDDELRGFGIRVTKNCISYIVERKIDGKTRRITLGRYKFMTPEVARHKAQALLLNGGFLHAADRSQRSVTLQEVLERFLEIRNLRLNTIRSYRGLTCRCFNDWLKQPIVNITRDMVQSRHQSLTRTTRQNSPGRVQANMAMRILRTLLNFAANNYESPDGRPLILVNAVCRLSQNRSWHTESRRSVVLADEQLGHWYKAVMSLKQETLRDYFLFLILTGLRRNEAATLRWADVDLRQRLITIRPEVAKNKKEHRLPLTDFLIELLSKRKENGSVFVFPGRSRKGHIVEIRHAVSTIRMRSSCSFVTHDLRRYFVSLAARLNIPHPVIKKLVNHIALKDVTDGYIVIQVDHLKEPMMRINDKILTLFGLPLS